MRCRAPRRRCSVMSKKFALLLWKNFVLQIRRPVGTFFELIGPPLAVVFIIALRFGVFPTEDRCLSTFESDPLTLPTQIYPSVEHVYTILYTPNSPEAQFIASQAASKLNHGGALMISLEPVDSEDAMEDLLVSDDDITRRCLGGAGIVFDRINNETSELEYTIRIRHEVGNSDTWNTGSSHRRFLQVGPTGGTLNIYASEGFLHLQKAVGEAIIEWKMNQLNRVLNTDFNLEVRSFPYPEYRADDFLSALGTVLPLALTMAFIYSAGVFVKELVLEKESRIRESMYMMGLSQWVLWSTWYIKQFIFLFISVFLVTLLTKFGQIMPRSDFFLLLVFFTLFATSTISFGFLVSVWADSARVGLIMGLLTFLLNFIPWLFICPQLELIDVGTQITTCVLSNTCLGFGVAFISQLEAREEGLQWSNAAEPLSVDNSFTMAIVYVMLIFDTVLYFLIAWYINAVKPGQYGVPKPLYFFLLPSYWTGNPTTSPEKAKKHLPDEQNSVDPTAHEEEPHDLDTGISIRNLTKIYENFVFTRKKKGSRKVAVKNLSLNMYKGQITALLGHNGAGKTTTMSMLTGLYTPTSGDAIVSGYSILTDIDQIRHSLGICPQHNILFDRLTVEEHLSFFCRIKGIWGESVKEEVASLIDDLQLVDKTKAPSSQLSGGQKRKLSVGIALVGGSDVVILDEPTSGMDPYARRATWDILTKHKRKRTLLLTTHFMDEADLLGDRIAIMVDGQVQCSGSSLFLKSRYGVGYHMVVEKEAQFNSEKLTNLIESMVQGAKEATNVGAELTYVLPFESASAFPQLFEAMEARKAELAIASFGISVTTMEEVFRKVGERADKKLMKRAGTLTAISFSPEPPVNPLPTSVTLETEISGEEGTEGNPNSTADAEAGGEKQGSAKCSLPSYVPNRGGILWVQQFVAVFVKRALHTLRFWIAAFFQFILPMVFLLIALILAKSLEVPVNDGSRELSIDNSAISAEIRVFYADFTGGSPGVPIDFGTVDPDSLGFDDWLNYTEEVTAIIEEVAYYNETSSCCSYEYQILDKFCASQSAADLDDACSGNGDFGYERCLECLDCCRARQARLPTCTSPLTLDEASSKDYCLSPPLLSATDAVNSDLSGLRLDSDNTYVAEHLLREEDEANNFFERYQAGFVISSSRDPPFSVCGCTSVSDTCTLFGSIEPATENDTQCPYPYYELNSGATISTITCPGNFSGCYSIDGYAADTIFSLACPGTGNSTISCEQGERPMSAAFPDQEEKLTMTVWYNGQPHHMAPSALNAFHTMWLRQATGTDVTLTVNNHPLPRTADSEVAEASDVYNGFIISILAVFGYCFLLASFVLSPVKEKETKAKHVQFVSGVHSTSYWTATFVWDLINATPAVVISIVLFAAFQLNAFTGDGLVAVFLLFTLACWSSIPMAYCFSFLFKESLAAFGGFVVFYFFSAFGTQLTIYVLQLQDFGFLVTPSLPDHLAETFHFIFLLVPSYSLGMGIQETYVNNLVRDACTRTSATRIACDSDDDIRYVDSVLGFARPGIGYSFIYMGVEGVLFFILTLVIEHSFFLTEIKNLYAKLRHVDPATQYTVEPTVSDTRTAISHVGVLGALGVLDGGEDIDVYNERKRVMAGQTTDSDAIVIKNLVKVYPRSLNGCTLRPAKKAVRGITLAIPTGECFGLLGVNGAGKTTTFNVLTGDISVSNGTAVIAGFDIHHDLRKVQRHIGYCPQFDALIENLTGRELLTVFARLRGIPEKHIKEVVQTEIRRLDLAKHAGKPCKTYSGGNKRKLSTAIALVGDPPIILLDEPTTGMDPVTRRFLWDVLTAITQEGRSIVLTSHSMEECEALCTRLAIMVNGRLKCLGSIQHLKNKYGSGFTLQAKVKLSSTPKPQEERRSSRRGVSRALTRVARQFSRGISSGSLQAPEQQVPENALAARPSLTVVPETPPSTARAPRRFSLFSRSSRRENREPADTPLDGGNPYDTTSLRIFIREAFPDAKLLEEHEGAVTYQLSSTGVSWSSVFRQLESNKERLSIVDYSVSQTTLDQVFINFAKKQHAEE